MSKLANVESFFKNVNLTCDDEVFVGVDVHKKMYHVALFLNDMPAIDFGMVAEPKQLHKKLQPMARSIRNITLQRYYLSVSQLEPMDTSTFSGTTNSIAWVISCLIHFECSFAWSAGSSNTSSS